MAKSLANRPLSEVFGYSRPRHNDLAEEIAPYNVIEQLAASKELMARCFAERLSTEEDLVMNSPEAVRGFLCTRLAHLEREVFAILWLDNRHRVLAFEELFHGTINQSSVYTREIVKSGLAINAGAALICHNHPSGLPEPSRADIQITKHIKEALSLVEIRLLDHLVVGGNTATSLQEMGVM
ncbi:hypothetical protein B1757_02945 [Acidithiobacillus marinus]|uniref:MPN domain-containing protein n=2 Tax=Acidithiobacillus marinus TaxID=187490 RepID=A0A2I1DPL6_9PROT|nr:hypothetical protein B1757_02945 [Acidithiobacillus marinus]